ncbi:large ribosomal subunit protein bL28m isoform X3 [Ambystoma mexicanum]|uniref:large ribosomal subunit protein bL28m isoform X3 n=1 Tax=Ambystoma mexicanum TaxID=8296 RepID=UPI0037E9191A
MPLHKYPPAIWKNLNLKEGIYSRLPSHYLQSLQETRKPTPVHWVPHGAKYKLNPKNGQRERVQDVPILPYFPPEADKGLWGGEGWISGFRYANNDKLSNRVKKTWKPQLFARELYSEILDKTFTITVTMRTMDLIDAAYGFDFYILKEFGPSLSGAEALGNLKSPLMESGPPDHHPNLVHAGMADTKEHVIPYEEAEWVGLTLEEAVEKQRLLEKKDPEPLFKVYAEELAQQLQSQQLAEPVIVEQKH